MSAVDSKREDGGPLCAIPDTYNMLIIIIFLKGAFTITLMVKFTFWGEIINTHILAGKKIDFFFLQQPGKYYICDQWITCAMPGS